jgi:hypothetical protein
MPVGSTLRAGIAGLRATLVVADGAAAASVTVDRARVNARLGDTFVFRTEIANDASTPTPALIAHLNILSLRDGVYVDPEDWSSRRTWYLGKLRAGDNRSIAWSVKAINGGSYAAYVAVLPQNRPVRPPEMSPTVRIAVENRATLDAGGILPLAVGVPALLALLGGGVRLARTRR